MSDHTLGGDGELAVTYLRGFRYARFCDVQRCSAHRYESIVYGSKLRSYMGIMHSSHLLVLCSRM